MRPWDFEGTSRATARRHFATRSLINNHFLRCYSHRRLGVVTVNHETHDRARAARHPRSRRRPPRARRRPPPPRHRPSRSRRPPPRARAHAPFPRCVCVCRCVFRCATFAATFASTRARADLAAHRHEIARVRVLLHVRRARARLAPAVVPIEAFQVHGQLSQPCMCMRAPRFSERSPRRSLNCTTASDAGSVGIGPLRVDRVAPSSRARTSSEEPQQLLRRSPGRADARSGGRARAIGRRALGTPEHGAHGRWKPLSNCAQTVA